MPHATKPNRQIKVDFSAIASELGQRGAPPAGKVLDTAKHVQFLETPLQTMHSTGSDVCPGDTTGEDESQPVEAFVGIAGLSESIRAKTAVRRVH